MKEVLHDYRCECGKLLLRGLILTGGVEVKCRVCKKMQTIDGLTGKLSTDTRYILFLNERGEVVSASDSAPTHVGFALEKIVGMHVTDLIVMLAPAFYSTLWEAFGEQGKTVVLFQTLQKHEDRSVAPVTIEAQPFIAADDRYVVFMVERKNAERQFGTGGTLQSSF
jgi:phage FluMu protein Com